MSCKDTEYNKHVPLKCPGFPYWMLGTQDSCGDVAWHDGGHQPQHRYGIWQQAAFQANTGKLRVAGSHSANRHTGPA